MRQYLELSAIIEAVLEYKMSQPFNNTNVSCVLSKDQKALFWFNVLEPYYECLQFWILGRYANFQTPDQLFMLLDETLLYILENTQSKILSQNLSFSYLTNLLQVFLDDYFQICK